MPSYTIGIDVGGTFTDLVLLDDSGHTRQFKAPSTPRDPSQGILEAVEVASRQMGLPAEDLLGRVLIFAHGSTVATNAILERRGAKVGLITTRGFEDTILIMRGLGRVAGLSESEITHYSRTDKPVPVVPRTLIQGVMERIDYKGAVVAPLNLEDAERAVESLARKGVESIGICLLWSFANPTHEEELKAIIEKRLPHVSVTASSQLIPVIGEYERTATTVLNCYVQPVLRVYMEKLGELLKSKGLKRSPMIMQCTGGVVPTAEANEKPIFTLNSGPVGGIVASSFLGGLLGYENLLNTDMGGTSFDVGLIANGSMLMTAPSIVARYHVSVPMVEITSIGSGGGSVAWIDVNKLRVGPQSAGADPGPACYARGGEEPTVTDANVILGYLNPDYFLGGRIQLNRKLSEEVIKRKIAETLQMDTVEAAAGIYEVVNAQMSDLLRKVTVERGYDPREFVLFAYGGAAPIHCAEYGKDLGVSQIIVPLLSSTHSAFGIAVSDLNHSLSISEHIVLPAKVDRIEANFKRLEERALEMLKREGVYQESSLLQRTLDMRYGRQVHEIIVPVPGRLTTPEDLEAVIAEFEKRYEMLYGKGAAFKEAGVEIITFRIMASARTPKPVLKRSQPTSSDSWQALKSRRMAFFRPSGGFTETPIYDSEKLRAGHELTGPAIVESATTTIVIPPGRKGRVDEYLNFIISA
ncbi:MAG: hydantoinase/oxoprolinase family protein [Acidobacteria bacterium]|nr:hydantoinase/oxoprolinase family protein [Acidobacteriota bacterium]